MNADEQAFFRAMEAAGEDDTPRLVYADWLEERGDSDRAKFIRLQVEAWQKHGYHHGGEYEKQFAKLLRKHRGKWFEGMPEWAIPSAMQFQRGFPNLVRFTGQQFLDDAGAIRERMPLSAVAFSHLQRCAIPVFESEHFEALRWVSLNACGLREPHLIALANSPRVVNLVTLRLLGGAASTSFGNRLTPAAVEAIAQSRHFRNLRSLDLGGYPRLPVRGIRLILESKHFAGLRELQLRYGTGRRNVTEAFAGKGVKVTHLEHLDLSYSKIDDEGLRILAESPHLKHLTELNLCDNPLTDDGVLALIRSPHLKQLRRLDLTGIDTLTDRIAEAILADGRDWDWVRTDSHRMSYAATTAIRFKLDPPPAQEMR